MKRTGLGWAIALVGLLWGSSLKAQTPQVTLTPDRITVAGSRCLLPGISCTQAERNVQLRADSAIAGVSILITDLQSTDGTNVFPEQAITVSLPEAGIQPSVPATIPISFHFRGVASGEFEGSLLLNYSGGERSLPITVRAKDAWLLPLLVVLFGVGVGYGVAVYRAEGATRDEILVQMGRLRSQ
ncbi:MAG: hypothetical protein HC925_03000 [Coleofasciculaceae cyanobacterium SM2_3_26]|nr:hypothetical protein [Coleofasciculaceae cyanobacterium SM2_3_26]